MEQKSLVIRSLIYKFLERFGNVGVTFVIQLLLARLLGPKDFGTISILTVFITISQVFVQSGFNTALIQKKEVDEIDYSSVFHLSFIVSVLMYLILFLIAPTIESFYGMKHLSLYLRVLSLTIIIGSFNSIQVSISSREMKFNYLMYSTILSGFLSGVFGVLLAFWNFGVWALIIQQLLASILNCFTLALKVKWFPKLLFSFERVKTLFSYGWKLLISSLLDTTYNQVQNLIIGRRYNAQTLGYYNRGQQFPQLVINNINGAIQSVMLPTLSKIQDDKSRIKGVMRRSIITSAFIIFPIMVGLAVLGNPIVKILLGSSWTASVPYLQINCFIFALMPIHTANLQAINAIGRSDIFLKLEILKKTIGIVLLILAVVFFRTPMAIAMGTAITGIVATIINSTPNSRLFHYNYVQQIKDILPYAVLSLIMGIIVKFVTLLFSNPFLNLPVGLFVGAISYGIIAYLLKLDALMYFLNILEKWRKKE